MLTRTKAALDTSIVRAATTISRRQLLRRGGTFALGAALSAALIGSEFSGRALATGTCSSPCGPSPFCGGANCNGSGQCGTGTPNCQNRPHNGSSCGAGTNCWTETYCPASSCPANPGSWKCCDCCCPSAPHGGGSCSGCSGMNTKWACICRSHPCSSCPC